MSNEVIFLSEEDFDEKIKSEDNTRDLIKVRASNQEKIDRFGGLENLTDELISVMLDYEYEIEAELNTYIDMKGE